MNIAIFVILSTLTVSRAQQSQDENKIGIPVTPANGLWLGDAQGIYWYIGGALATQNNIPVEPYQAIQNGPQIDQSQTQSSHIQGGNYYHGGAPHEHQNQPTYYDRPHETQGGTHFSTGGTLENPGGPEASQNMPYPVQAGNHRPQGGIITDDNIHSNHGGTPNEKRPHFSHGASSQGGSYSNQGGNPTQNGHQFSHGVSYTTQSGSHHSQGGSHHSQGGSHHYQGGSHPVQGGSPGGLLHAHGGFQTQQGTPSPSSNNSPFLQSESDFTQPGIPFPQNRLMPIQGGSPYSEDGSYSVYSETNSLYYGPAIPTSYGPGSSQGEFDVNQYGNHFSQGRPYYDNNFAQYGPNFPIHHKPQYFQSGISATQEGNHFPIGGLYPSQGGIHYTHGGFYPNQDGTHYSQGTKYPIPGGAQFLLSKPPIPEDGTHFPHGVPQGIISSGSQLSHDQSHPIPNLPDGSDIHFVPHYPHIEAHENGNLFLEGRPHGTHFGAGFNQNHHDSTPAQHEQHTPFTMLIPSHANPDSVTLSQQGTDAIQDEAISSQITSLTNQDVAILSQDDSQSTEDYSISSQEELNIIENEAVTSKEESNSLEGESNYQQVDPRID